MYEIQDVEQAEKDRQEVEQAVDKILPVALYSFVFVSFLTIAFVAYIVL